MILPDDLTKHVKATYTRVILPNAAAAEFIRNYKNNLHGKVTYEFAFPAINARIIGIVSLYGNISAQFTDHPESFDQWRRDTRIMYDVDDVPEVLKAAERSGLKIVQSLAKTPVAWQGRFEVSPGFVVEVIKWLPGKEPK